jgi:hypothetical protein
VGVEADAGVVAELLHERGDPVGGLVEHNRARGVHDVDALAAVVGDDARLGRQVGRRQGVAHHQEAGGLHA